MRARALINPFVRQSFGIKANVIPVLLVSTAAALAACQPTVKVEAPDKPIVINLNIKIEQEVRVKIDKELDEAFADNPDIFE